MNKGKYPSIVEKIHQEFFSASDKALAEAAEILNRADIQKVEALKKAGFISSKEVIASKKVVVHQEAANAIQYYRNKYPFNKFILKEQVEALCKKYNLVCGAVGRYTGFVPQSKLNEITKFNVDKQDTEILVEPEFSFSSNDADGIKSLWEKYPSKNIPLNLITGGSIRGFGGWMGHISVSGYKIVEDSGLKICAPIKQFNLKGLTKMGSFLYKLSYVSIPDPVVLQPVKGGYLIIAAWGDEASDPIVVNEINN